MFDLLATPTATPIPYTNPPVNPDPDKCSICLQPRPQPQPPTPTHLSTPTPSRRLVCQLRLRLTCTLDTALRLAGDTFVWQPRPRLRRHRTRPIFELNCSRDYRHTVCQLRLDHTRPICHLHPRLSPYGLSTPTLIVRVPPVNHDHNPDPEPTLQLVCQLLLRLTCHFRSSDLDRNCDRTETRPVCQLRLAPYTSDMHPRTTTDTRSIFKSNCDPNRNPHRYYAHPVCTNLNLYCRSFDATATGTIVDTLRHRL
ncbi:hypothetical protein M427DRAFT_246471 [Gonapodya prolifera JEL478]|uniref:Uncharacterized protein n=1 Tax=Gonapodya prolifera (strain JEL478) TaxID=1344416 RepID=A0A139ALY7_GONPJ|nr:hypothetical protein M427DRAFT_246471 [Gonapodya prolifera JEL478]|eukprot:KXS17796.1 hypothetical protein M427DRAFT_246471 [Gonapodya prolifera JEL478]